MNNLIAFFKLHSIVWKCFMLLGVMMTKGYSGHAVECDTYMVTIGLTLLFCMLTHVILYALLFAVKPVMRGHLLQCINYIFCEPDCTLVLKCTCDEETPVI